MIELAGKRNSWSKSSSLPEFGQFCINFGLTLALSVALVIQDTV